MSSESCVLKGLRLVMEMDFAGQKRRRHVLPAWQRAAACLVPAKTARPAFPPVRSWAHKLLHACATPWILSLFVICVMVVLIWQGDWLCLF